jgi:trigger factor
MKVSLESKKGLKTKLKIFIDKKIIQEKIEVRLIELSKTVNLKGFRPGKVPVQVLKRQFGQSVYGEVLEKTLRETSAKAIEDKKIKVAGQPKLDLKSHGEGKDLSYTIEVDELPLIKLESLDSIKFIDYEIEVSEKENKKRIDDIAKNQNNFSDKKENEVAQNGDMVIFDYKATIENKDFEGGEGKSTQIILGKDLFIKGFDKQLLGVKKNQEKDVVVALPENYPKKEFANKKSNFKCKILKIKKPEPIKIDDKFAASLGAKDLKDLKHLVNTQIKNQYKMNLDALSKDNILNQIEKIHKINLPDNLVQQELDVITKGLKDDEVKKNNKNNEKIAKKRIKLGLILNEIGEKNNLKVEEEELKKEIQKQVQSMPGQEKQVMEYYKQNPSAALTLRGSIYEEKIINLIKEKSKATKKIISIKDAEKLIQEQHKTHDHSHHDHHDHSAGEGTKKPKKSTKSSKKSKKIRKK